MELFLKRTCGRKINSEQKHRRGRRGRNFVPTRILRSCHWDECFEDMKAVFHLKTFEDHQEDISYKLNYFFRQYLRRKKFIKV